MAFPLVGPMQTDSLTRTGKHYYTIAGPLTYTSPGLCQCFWKQQGLNIIPTIFTDGVSKAVWARETSVLLVQCLVELLKSLCWSTSVCISRGPSIGDFQTKEDHDIIWKATTKQKNIEEREKTKQPPAPPQTTTQEPGLGNKWNVTM